ncbi:hypothetical protein J14TS2_12300 [Bacillus sp. J14TS2]|uniref:hypothetical protein n=1 Tax=Bacillus sp. J14TS2 TaxID=2807188 RepID=UPI001B0B1757|nr:hypothetical protein [Bacillus sp. J14TS2]GIN70755.1 hypothetical protein J14TS2_12300 [Bacillus sp. J14TS2]
MGSTSYPSIKIGGNAYALHNSESSNVSVSESLTEKDGLYKVVYEVKDEEIDVKVSQYVNIVRDKYQIKYRIENQSATKQDIGFLFNNDTQLGSDDHAPFMMSEAPIKYQGNDIPGSFIVYNNNETNPECKHTVF